MKAIFISKITRTTIKKRYVYYRVYVPKDIVEELRRALNLPPEAPIPVKVILKTPTPEEIISGIPKK